MEDRLRNYDWKCYSYCDCFSVPPPFVAPFVVDVIPYRSPVAVPISLSVPGYGFCAIQNQSNPTRQ